MMSAMVDRGLLSGILVGSRNDEEMVVSHLLFADCMLIFCKPSVEQFRNLRCPFLFFEAVSGLKINLSKSEILPVGDVGFVADEVFGSSLGCSL
jgi:hypothetical protein